MRWISRRGTPITAGFLVALLPLSLAAQDSARFGLGIDASTLGRRQLNAMRNAVPASSVSKVLSRVFGMLLGVRNRRGGSARADSVVAQLNVKQVWHRSAKNLIVELAESLGRQVLKASH